MPILKLPDGTSLAQSRAITRYLGTVVTYSGAPLYPTDPLARYNADQLIELCEDMRSPIGATFAIKDQAEKEAARQALFARPDGRSAKWLKVLDGAAKGCENPNFKGSYFGRFPLVSADFSTSDHLSERSRSVNVYFGTRARGTAKLKRR